MKTQKRISIVLKCFEAKKAKKNFINCLFPEINSDEKAKIIECWKDKKSEVKKRWRKNPELRLVQVLVDLDIIPNWSGFWFYTDEIDYLIEKNIKQPRDILFWIKRYDKNMNRLNKRKYILIKNMDTDHIKKIVYKDKYFVRKIYIDAFIKELKLRNTL